MTRAEGEVRGGVRYRQHLRQRHRQRNATTAGIRRALPTLRQFGLGVDAPPAAPALAAARLRLTVIYGQW